MYPSSLSCSPYEWRPFILDYLSEDDRKEIVALQNDPAVMVHDMIESQAGEFLKCTHPEKKLKDHSLQEAIDAFFQKNDRVAYGKWVYYPWNRKLVHLLPEEEFISTRTSPNNPKITLAEQAILRKKKVGVVGLSVGQSISLVLAMERICGELRIADFDVLELANLNRIRAGVHNMGVNKSVLVAREIMEIDPYFNLHCYPEGLTAANMNAFFHEGGDLDVIVDECDSIDIKIELRKKARSMRIPVVMDMSDRGTIDIERFDLEPDRPVLHGWIDHLDYSNIGKLTNDEKVPFMLPVFGIDTMGKKLKASMVEIGESIHTWPQLATSVALGGALAADTLRRIFLDQFHDSGRYFIDLDDLITDKAKTPPGFIPQKFSFPPLEKDAMKREATSFLAKKGWGKGQLEEALLDPVIELAALAPSAGNNQPWRWLFLEGHLFLFHEKSRSYSWTDFDDTMAFLGLGAAAESLRLAAGRFGLSVEMEELETGQLVAGFRLKEDPSLVPDPLAGSLEMRCTNRKKGKKVAFTENDRNNLAKSAEPLNGLCLFIENDPEQIDRIAGVVGRAEKLRFLTPQGHHEFFNDELRWNAEEAEKTRDGLDIRTLELSVTQNTGMEVSSDPAVMDLIRLWKGGRALEKVSGDAVRASSAIGMLYTDPSFPSRSLKNGAAILRTWIAANKNGWAIHPITAPLFFINRLKSPQHLLSLENIAEIESFRKDLIKIIPILHEEKGIFLFRLSHSDEVSVRSLRLNKKEILIRG